MKKMIWAVVALLGFAAWADLNTALDCNGLTFTTGGDANWYEQMDDFKVGTSAMRSGAITNNQETWIGTTVTNTGTISFWWKVSSEESYDELAVIVDNMQKAAISGTGDDWARKSVIVTAGQTVRWSYSKDSSEDDGSDCAWLDGVEYMPAPESMTVTFMTNGGDEIAPTNVTPGITYGELPVPQKEGNEEFGGWYLDEELTAKASNDAFVEFRDHTLYAKWRFPVSLLNTDGLEFSTDDDYLPWEAVAEAEASGGYAVRGPVDPDRTGGYLYLWTTNGSGTLSYKWKIDGDGNGTFYEYNYQDGNNHYFYGEDTDWQTRTICLYSDNETEMSWYSSSKSAALMLSDFAWTPAPETMTITFVTNGGDEIAPTNVAPGITYGELPVPQKEGNEEFVGWYLDEELTEKAYSDDLVTFRDHTLYAKWEIPVSVLNADGLEFSTSDETWRLPWEAVAEAGASGGYAVRGPVDPDRTGGYLYLWTTNGSGTLSYKWKIDGDGNGTFYEYNYQDGNNHYFYGEDTDWQTRTICLYSDNETEMSWYSSSKSAALMLSDFVWTPAPETMTITFVTNGGDEIAPTNVAPGITYGELPVPQKEGDEEFAGWYLDEELTEKASNDAFVEFRDHTLYAKWRLPVSVLNADGLEFSTSDETWRLPWEAVAEAGASGGYAVRGPVDPDRTGGYLYLWTTNGPGTLSYKRKTDRDGSGTFYESHDGEHCGFGSCEDWQTRTVRLYGDNEDGDRVTWYSSSTSAALMLSDFVWTPAPEAITVSFNANGGTLSGADSRTYGPRERYGRDGEEKLPVPVRTGFTFLGWREESVSGKKVVDTDRVPWRETVTLVARWGAAVSAFNTSILTKFTSSGADKWYAVDEPCLAKVAEVEPKGQVKTLVKTVIRLGTLCDPEYSYVEYSYKKIEPTVSVLQTPIAKEGFLSFRWSLKNGGATEFGQDEGSWPSASIVFYLDGNKIAAEQVWYYDEETDSRQVYVYIPAGKHTLKWEVQGNRAYYFQRNWNADTGEYDETATEAFGSEPVARVWDFEFEPAGPQPDLQAWAGKVKRYESWRTGDLARFAAVYKARMIADGEDYEARILYAATRLGALAENAQFKTYAKTFGMTIDWARMSVTPPSPKFDKNTAAVNTMVDKTIALATPAIQDAQAALADIPEDWAGSVTFDSDNWPIDETVALDIADVLFARAGLDAALAGLNYLGAYDLTVNWTKVSAAQKLETKIPVVTKLPAIGEAASWEKSAQSFRTGTVADGDKGDGVGAAAISGNTLSLRLVSSFEEGWLNDTNQISFLEFALESGDLSLNVWCGHDYGDATDANLSCWVYDSKSGNETRAKATIATRGNELVLNVDLKALNFGTKKKPVGFSKKSWSIGWGYVEIDSYGDGGCTTCSPGGWMPRGSISWDRPNDNERRVMKFINDQTALFSKVRDAARLSASRRHFKAALERALDADAKALARPEGDGLHFFEYDPEDKAVIDFARENTERALAALDAPTVMDFKKIAEDWDATKPRKHKLADYNYSLLPDEGMTRIYLGAIFEGKITRALLPPMRTNIYGEIVPDFDAMQDPTIGGLIPDMTRECLAEMEGRFAEEHELDHGEPTDLDALPKPGEKLVLDYAQYKGYTVSGLPKGWKWDSKKGVLSGTAASTFTVTFAKKGKPSVKVTIEVGPKPAVLLFSDDETAVAVTGTGLYNVGATAKAVAAVRNGYAFGGWYDENGNLVSPLAVYSFKMTRKDVSLMATTIPLGKDELYAKPADRCELELNVDCGDLTPFWVRSKSPVSVSVAGLPPGLLASNAVEAAGDAFEGYMHITGTPTKEGVYYATFVAKNNGGFKWTAVVKFVVGGASENETNTANINWDSYADGEGEANNYWFYLSAGWPFEAIMDVPNSSSGSAPVSVVATKTVKKKTTSTLPPGLSASFKNGRIVVSGQPSTPGKFTIEFTVTYKNKKTAKAVKTVVVKDSGSVYIPTGVIDNDPNGAVRGTVAYVGVKQYGQTVKFTATTKDKKNWFFGGWYLDEELMNSADAALPGIDWRAATVSAQIGEETWSLVDGMYARFVTKAEEAAEGLAIECEDFWRVRDEDGMITQLPINRVVSATKPTLSASGLPAGTKLSGMKLVVSKPAALVPGWYKVTLTAKTAAGNTVKKVVDVLVPNVTTAKDMGLIEGLYTGDEGYTSEVHSFMQAGVKQTFTLDDLGVTVSNGWTLAVTGLPKGWTYNASTKTFTGVATKVGKTTVTFTVSRKVSKKKTESYKATATFDLDPLPTWATGAFVGKVGNAYVRMDVASNGVISGYRQDVAGKKTFKAEGFTANEEGTVLSTTLKGTGVSLPVTVCACENLGVEQGVAEFNGGVAYSNPWAIEGANPLPVFPEDAACEMLKGSGTLTLKFGAKGTVTCVYTVGKNATSGSTQIGDLSWNEEQKAWTANVALALAKKVDKKGKVLVPALVDSIPLTFLADDEGQVIKINSTAD